MKYLLFGVIIHLIFTLISLVVNYKRASDGYRVKDLIVDCGYCMLPIVNMMYPISVLYEVYIKEKLCKLVNNVSRKCRPFLNKRIK